MAWCRLLFMTAQLFLFFVFFIPGRVCSTSPWCDFVHPTVLLHKHQCIIILAVSLLLLLFVWFVICCCSNYCPLSYETRVRHFCDALPFFHSHKSSKRHLNLGVFSVSLHQSSIFYTLHNGNIHWSLFIHTSSYDFDFTSRWCYRKWCWKDEIETCNFSLS